MRLTRIKKKIKISLEKKVEKHRVNTIILYEAGINYSKFSLVASSLCLKAHILNDCKSISDRYNGDSAQLQTLWLYHCFSLSKEISNIVDASFLLFHWYSFD